MPHIATACHVGSTRSHDVQLGPGKAAEQHPYDPTLELRSSHRQRTPQQLRRVQLQSDDVGRLGLKVRVVGGDIAFESVRPQSMLSPHARDHHVGDIQLRTQFSRTRMRGSIIGFALHAPLQDACFQNWRQHRRHLPGVTTKQSRQAFLHKPLAHRSMKLSLQSSLLRITAHV